MCNNPILSSKATRRCDLESYLIALVTNLTINKSSSKIKQRYNDTLFAIVTHLPQFDMFSTVVVD
ncbi:MAG: hypothetical protein P0116_17280 [Candidatus Nitrosocosmicus sp.]|nr:hypothetical protein [Candidatus Nitrosocosmicus sp.]